MKVTITCGHCGKRFTGQEGRKYCSHPCYLVEQKRPLMERFWERVRKTEDGCWLWTGTKVPGGYGILSEGGRPVQHSVHRLSYEFYFGPIPEGMHVCHRCDVQHCVNPAHLFIGTAKDNSQDMVKKGRSSRGAKNGMSKLTETDVRSIRERYAAGGITQKQLAIQRGLGQATVANIINRRRWSHVK